MKKNSRKKKSRIRWLFLALLLVVVIAGVHAVYKHQPRGHHSFRTTVVVKDLTKQIKNVADDVSLSDTLPPEFLAPFKQSLRLTVQDLAKPPVVADDKSQEGTEQTQELPAYEEKAPSANIPLPVAPPQHMKATGKPRLALVIDDVGLNVTAASDAMKLPAAVTLSFLPYAPRLQEQADKAHDAGHELLLHMPMQPMGNDNPGAGALLLNLPMEENQTRLNKALDSFNGFDGINNHMGSKYTSSRDSMGMVVRTLQQRGLFFLDSRTSGQSVGAKVAQEHGVPHISRDVFIDDEIKATAIEAQLAQAEQLAQHKGYAVIIGHPHAETLKVLQAWVKDVQKRGFELVPVGSLVRD